MQCRKNHVALILALFLAFAPTVFADQSDDLKAHLQTFSELNFGGSLGFNINPVEVISPGSDIRALADLVAKNWWVFAPDGSSLLQVSGDDADLPGFLGSFIGPKLVDGALVAEVIWDVGIVTYAIVAPGGAAIGDTQGNFESLSMSYVVEDNARNPAGGTNAGNNSYKKKFKNGFGSHVATYEATLKCVSGDTCSGNATCWEGRVGCSCSVKKKVKCLANGNCQMDVAFAGHCGFPSVKFKAKDFAFEVSGWGWQYFNASITLDEPCECTAAQQDDTIPTDHHTPDGHLTPRGSFRQ